MADSIAGIHNLELRLYILKRIEGIVHAVMNDRHLHIVKFINQIAKMIEEEAKEFNAEYDKLVAELLWLFKDDEKWKRILWLRNIENTEYSELLSEIKDDLHCSTGIIWEDISRLEKRLIQPHGSLESRY